MKRVIAGALLVAATASARAENPKAAERIAQGKKLLLEKRYADSCAAFHEADTIEHGLRAELGIAECNDGWGKLATALDAYELAAQMAAAARDPRESKIREKIADLDPQVPRLTISLPKDASAAGVVVTFDGQPLAATELGKERKVDPGPHQLEYKTATGATKSKLIPLERGGSSEITLDLPAADVGEGSAGAAGSGATAAAGSGEGSALQPVPDRLEPDASAGHGRRIAGFVGMGVGVVGLGVSVGITVSARSKYRDALDSHCNGDPSMCDGPGLTSTHDARHEANIATVIASASAVVAAAGLVVYLTAPHGSGYAHRREHERRKPAKHDNRDDDGDDESLRLVPSIRTDGAGFALLGRF